MTKEPAEIKAFVFRDLICRYPVEEIAHDNAGEFEAEIAQLGRDMAIKMTTTSPYRPQANGLVERLNQTLKQGLYRLSERHPESWSIHLVRVLRAYRSTPHSSTKLSPARVMTGCELPPIGMGLLSWSTYAKDLDPQEPELPQAFEWVGQKVEKLFMDPNSKVVSFYKGDVRSRRIHVRGQEEFRVVYSDGDQRDLDIDELLPWWAKTPGSTYLELRNYDTVDVDISTSRVELALIYMRSEGGKLAKQAEQLCTPGLGLKHVLDEVLPPRASNEDSGLAPPEVTRAIEQMESLAAVALANNKKAQEKQAQMYKQRKAKRNKRVVQGLEVGSM